MYARPSVLELQRTLYRSKNATRRWLHCTRRDWIIAALKRHRPVHCQRAMEVGPGSGLYLPTLLELATSVVALDIAHEFLEETRRLAGRNERLEVIRGNITQLDLPASHFDLILCSEVLEHIPDSAAAIRQVRRLLRPGGVLVLSTPHKWSSLEIAARIALLPAIIDIIRLIYREPVLKTGHINLMTKHEMTSQLNNAGFIIVERHTSGLYIPIIAEFFGKSAVRLETALESLFRNNHMEQLLWTQYYVATLPVWVGVSRQH